MAGIKSVSWETLLIVGNGRSAEFFRPDAARKTRILRHADPVPNVQNHVTFRTHFTGSILYTLAVT